MNTSALRGRSVLIVEDEPLIALDIELALNDIGAQWVTTSTLAHALILVEHDGLTAAILDHSLGRETSTTLYERLNQRGIPFLIYSATPPPEADRKGGVVLTKPSSPEKLLAALEALIRGG
jgi:DNA-binding response OmpR family regulator